MSKIMPITHSLLILLFVLFVAEQLIATPKIKPEKSLNHYVGSSSCTECHQLQMKQWRGSHHALAMQHASAKSVLGDFNNKIFTYNGITSTFNKKENNYFVTTDGPDGKLKKYQIKYTFGFTPLQQYLIEFPGGRLQALGIAWDTRTKKQGGQRWYHLYPDQKITFKDRLHWTRVDQNWNYMCAECHSTNLQKNYNSETNSYKTSWTEISVTCESCHGPGSAHINWAKTKKAIDENKGLEVNFYSRSKVNWIINKKTGIAKSSSSNSTNFEIDVCARCHSRRGVISNNYTPGQSFMDHYQPALLTDFLYYPDGQIKEEVYVYGSFIQSKMYHQGVTCSDCHNPHSTQLRAKGNAVCLQCHLKKKYDQITHHFHKPTGKGALCAECHMPQTVFMGVDGRHDHSIRIPRPDLSIKLNTPNACNNCHKDKTPTWANKKMMSWYGKDWSPGWIFGETLFDARNNKPGISQDLAAVAASPKLPAIARATATDLMQYHPGPITYVVINKLLKDSNAKIRLAALQTLDTLPAQNRFKAGVNLLTDPVRAVRIEAARILALVPANLFSAQQQLSMDKAITEYQQAQLVNADRPESFINLGLLEIRLQKFKNAEKFYQQALQLDPTFVNAYVNLADLYRMQQQDTKAELVLKKALQISTENSDVYYALGLLYVRQKQMNKALQELKTAWHLQKDNARYAYVYAVALNSLGQTKLAIVTLKKVHLQHPNNSDIVSALMSFYRSAGKHNDALVFARKLQVLIPDNPEITKLIQTLESEAR